MPERAELGDENLLASIFNQGVMGSNPIGLTKSSENSRVRTLLGWRPPASLNPVNHAPPALRPDPFSLVAAAPR